MMQKLANGPASRPCRLESTWARTAQTEGEGEEHACSRLYVSCPSVQLATKAFGGAPYGATKRVRGVRKRARWAHANAATAAVGGAPDGATKRVRGLPKWMGGGMWALPLGRSLELPMGPRNV